MSEASEWINALVDICQASNADTTTKVSFSAFYASQLPPTKPSRDISTLLPLLNESINSPAMVSHCFKVISKIVQELNPLQPTVITVDQPVYAIAKQVQWSKPEDYKDVVVMMGPLHIKMTFLNATGNWLEGSGWVDVFERARLTTVGRIDSFLKDSKVKRSRYAHQVSLASLVKLAKDGFESQSEYSNCNKWKKNRCAHSSTANYWFTVIDLEILLFIFIRSLREGNFSLFVMSLKNIAPWMFALDHIHYARWLPVFLEDLEQMKNANNPVVDQFNKGFFTVNKTGHPFSNIGIDQAHEQNNKIVKVDGGAIGILDNDAALLKWAITGPTIINEILNEAGASFSPLINQSKRHEDTDLFVENFQKDRNALLTAFTEYENPFYKDENMLV